MKCIIAGMAAALCFAAPALAAQRDTNPPRATQAPKTMAIEGAVIATPPRPDLYPEAGGFDPDDGTSLILLIGNKGSAAAAETHVRFFMKIGDEDVIRAEYPMPALDPGAYYEMRVPSIIPVDWLTILYARIDQPAKVDELDEKNNAFNFKKPLDRARKDSGDAHLDYLTVGLYERPETVDAASGLATGKRQHRPLTATAPSSGPTAYSTAPTAPRVACIGEPGLFICKCGDTPEKTCSEKLKAANCTDHTDPDGLQPPDGYNWSCSSDQSD